MSKKTLRLLNVILPGAFILIAGVSFSAEKTPPPSGPPQDLAPPYTATEAFNSIMNPHNQINDEGEVLWNRCMVCHRNIPDERKEKNIKDVRLRADDFNEICLRCHVVKPHPGAEGVELTMSSLTALNHLVVPPKIIYDYMRMSLKETPLILPLDFKTGKIVCSTCHNPHERGLLTGKADFGADSSRRLRSEGVEVCQYCHRK